MEIVQLIAFSPKRQALFERMKPDTGEPKTPGIKPLCPTRWTVRAKAFTSLLKNYGELQDTLDIVAEGSDEYARRASGLLALMQQFSTFFGLKLSLAVFAPTEELSATLQAKSASCGDATAAVDICLKTLQKLRSEESFSGFFEEVTTEARQFCDEPHLPRQRQPPRRIDGGAQGHVFETAADFYRQQFFETVDHIVQNIQARFDQESFGLPRQIEELLVAAASGEKNILIPEQVATVFREDIDLARLKTQLCMVPDTFTTPPEKKIPAVIKGLSYEMQEADSVRRMLSEVDKLIKLYLTIPVTTATAERTFSALKRVKSYLRSSMTQERLNHCVILHVFKERVDELRVEDIAAEFVARNVKRRNFFGSFMK